MSADEEMPDLLQRLEDSIKAARAASPTRSPAAGFTLDDAGRRVEDGWDHDGDLIATLQEEMNRQRAAGDEVGRERAARGRSGAGVEGGPVTAAQAPVGMTGNRTGVYRRYFLEFLRDHGRAEDGHCSWCPLDDWGTSRPGDAMRWAPRHPATGEPLPILRFGGV